MKIIVDTSIIISVLVNETHKNSIIENNTLLYSTEKPVEIASSDYFIAKYNVIYNSSFEIYISETHAININKCNHGIFTYNLLQSCYYGIYLDIETKNVIIHHNSFVENRYPGDYEAAQGRDDGTDNIWYDELKNEGNYWSDWSGEGSYQIEGSANTEDPYPLTNPSIQPIEEEKAGFPFLFLIPVLICGAMLSKRRKKI